MQKLRIYGIRFGTVTYTISKTGIPHRICYVHYAVDFYGNIKVLAIYIDGYLQPPDDSFWLDRIRFIKNFPRISPNIYAGESNIVLIHDLRVCGDFDAKDAIGF